MSSTLSIFFLLLLSYISGSVPYGLLLARLAGLGDVRQVGSGNIGATNVLRTGNKGVAAATLLLDFLKGLAPVLVAHYFFANSIITFASGLCAILGHIFPIWLRFKGGKGVATALGVYAGLHIPLALITIGIWLLMAKIGRISSLSALVSFLVSPFIALFIYDFETGLFCLIVAVVILFTHRENLKRIMQGEEGTISL